MSGEKPTVCRLILLFVLYNQSRKLWEVLTIIHARLNFGFNLEARITLSSVLLLLLRTSLSYCSSSHKCVVTHIARVWINRVRLPILLVVSWAGKMNISLSSFAPENLVSRDGFGSPVPRQPAHLHTQAEPGANLRDSSRVPRRRPFIYKKNAIILYAIGSAPSLSDHAIAYRWRSLPRVRRHRASKPYGSSERVLPWQVTMDQSIFNMRLTFPHPLFIGMKWVYVESTSDYHWLIDWILILI